jgi:hypothetical protein
MPSALPAVAGDAVLRKLPDGVRLSAAERPQRVRAREDVVRDGEARRAQRMGPPLQAPRGRAAAGLDRPGDLCDPDAVTLRDMGCRGGREGRPMDANDQGKGPALRSGGPCTHRPRQAGAPRPRRAPLGIGGNAGAQKGPEFLL